MAVEIRVTDPQEIALLTWMRVQLAEFCTRPQRWQAVIITDGSRVTGELSKIHRVTVRVDTGAVSVDGEVRDNYVEMHRKLNRPT